MKIKSEMTTSSAGSSGTKPRKATFPSARNAANTSRRSSGCAAGATEKTPHHARRDADKDSRTRETVQRQESNNRRPYDHHDGEDDQKAKDKRYWFNRQDNEVCNYCGHRYRYDQLEMEHMIPKELGGPDHRRNM